MKVKILKVIFIFFIFSGFSFTPHDLKSNSLKNQSFKIQILHSSDNESSFTDPATLEPKILNYATILSGLREYAKQKNIPSLYITAGDHTLPGPFFHAAQEISSLGANGLADIEFYNLMGLQANGMGNHEFDSGIDDFAFMLNKANYPFIAANLDFSKVRLKPNSPKIQIGEDASNAKDNAGKVVRSAYVEIKGEKVGLIGHAPPDFFNVLEDPDVNHKGLDFFGGREKRTNAPLVSALGQVLEQVHLLESKGINKIVLFDHAQDYTNDPLTTRKLEGIDIIITAGSTGFLAKERPTGPFNSLKKGAKTVGEYPLYLKDKNNNPVLIINTDQQYSYVGQLIVEFDKNGLVKYVEPESGPVAATKKRSNS